MKGLKVVKTREGDGDVVRLVGSMHAVPAADLLREMPAGNRDILLDCEDLLLASSAAAREWMIFMQGLCAARRVTLSRVQPLLACNLNMMPLMVASAAIESLYAPFSCWECKSHRSILVTVGEELTSDGRLTVAPQCDTCREALELDQDPEDYFRAVAASKRPAG